MASAGTQAITTAGGAWAQSNAQSAQGEYEASGYEINARLSEAQAADARHRGKLDEKAHRKDVKRLIGSQRAAMAAQGIDLEDGSALDVVGDTAAQGELDALTIRNNAWREAWGYETQAIDSRSRGRFASMASKAAARDTLITGGMKAFGHGLQFGSEYYKGKGK